VLIPLLALAVLVEYLLTLFGSGSVTQVSFHFFGFVTGIGVFYSLFRVKKRRILQLDAI
jgi:hypothetical protein